LRIDLRGTLRYRQDLSGRTFLADEFWVNSVFPTVRTTVMLALGPESRPVNLPSLKRSVGIRRLSPQPKGAPRNAARRQIVANSARVSVPKSLSATSRSKDRRSRPNFVGREPRCLHPAR
jgi:hypothetical protein